MTIKNCFLAPILLQTLVSIQINASSKKIVPPKAVEAKQEAKKPDTSNIFDLKNFERLANITISSDIKKYYSDIDKVDGWFDKRHIIILLLINLFQTKNSINGNLGEIGVWQGKSFIPLMLLAKNNEYAAAIDCFESYEFNRDNSGGGSCSFEIFNKNVEKYCSKHSNLRVIKGDSSSFSAKDYLSVMENGKGFRIFSIDGCHEAPSTIKDMENAFNCLADGGVIIIDDYFHTCWPGVSEGLNFFMNKNVNCLKPFLIAWNKIFFAQPAFAKKYFDLIKEFLIPNDVRIKKFFGVDTLIYDKQG